MREFGQKTALGRTAFTHGVTWRWRREEEGSVLRERSTARRRLQFEDNVLNVLRKKSYYES